MYKILIVEDEKIERDSLKRMITGFDLDITEIVTAENGEHGLKIFKEIQPDIVLADINMPKLGGLDMIEMIRKENSDVICLILTSYDYFSYAQRAIRLNVEDFILKPADQATLKHCIVKAVEKLHKDKNTYVQTSSLVQKMNQVKNLLESECFYAILTRQDESKLIENFKMNGINMASGICFIFNDLMMIPEYLSNFRSDVEDLGYVCIQGNINENYIMFIISNHIMTQGDSKTLDYLINIHKLRRFNFAVGGLKNDAISLYTSYEEALYNLRNTGEEKNEILIHNNEENQLVSLSIDWANQFLDNIEIDNRDLIKKFCRELMQYGNKDTNKIMSLIIHQMAKEINEKYNVLIDINELDEHLITNGNYQNLEIIVNQMLQKILKPVKNIKYQNSSHLIKKAMKFIDKNYKKPISLNDLADELNVSSFYISKLFSKEGQNFTEIVNDLRIKEAKRLIKKDYTFKEVAFNVGFGSQSYFTKIFKKKVGMSPKEYRNMF